VTVLVELHADQAGFAGIPIADGDGVAVVGLWDPPYVEQGIVHGGNQSMPLAYEKEDADMVAAAVKSVDREDWTLGGVQTLTLFFLGDRENEGGTLYVQINNAKVDCDSELNLGLWKQWNIDLSEFNTDLHNVTSITIGVDGIGSGLVYVDEIRLYVEAVPAVEAVDPGNDNLVLWYEFEDNLNDSSNSQLDASAELTMHYDDSLTGLGQALEFDGIDDFANMPIGNLMTDLTQCCFSIWVQIDEDATGTYMRAFDVGTGTDNYLLGVTSLPLGGFSINIVP
jgi:hypothetical protein